MKDLKLFKDWGVTATLSTLVIIGSFVILFRVADKINPDTLITLVGSWVSAIVAAIVVIKSGEKQG